MQKPHKGVISNWYKYHFDVEQYREMIPEETLGYIVIGFRQGLTMMKTSPVIYFDEYSNQIETLNSWYQLDGDEHVQTE